MNLSIGIVGLPNVGKSTLFNVMVKSSKAEASNYPFCTIDPNVGIVPVPDSRLLTLSNIVSPEKIVPAVVEFVDIAGIIKGASQGEGLGNAFLSHIRDTSALMLVARYFHHDDIIHVDGSIDPKRDLETVILELILADIQTCDKALIRYQKSVRSNDKDAVKTSEIIAKILDGLNQQVTANVTLTSLARQYDDSLISQVSKELRLLTSKQMFVVANIDESDLDTSPQELFQRADIGSIIPNAESLIPVCAKIEEEIAACPEEDQMELLETYGLTESGLNRLISTAY